MYRAPPCFASLVLHCEVAPKAVHVLLDGRIVRTGGKELALELEEKGYGWIEEEVAIGA